VIFRRVLHSDDATENLPFLRTPASGLGES
jgi:hypothetical protein